MDILKEVVAELVKMFVADARLSVAVLVLSAAWRCCWMSATPPR